MTNARDAAIVYGVYINPTANWRSLIEAQLKDVSQFGVLSACDLYVSVTNPSSTEGVMEFFKGLHLPIKNLEIYTENRFEYPAIARVWDIAASSSNYKYIGYLHTKGMSYAKKERDRLEAALTFHTFSQWQKIFRLFESNPSIEKIGVFPAYDGELRGWIWFNFWWSRAKYIRNLPKPAVDPNRYYYEGWLSRQAQTDNNTYSLLSDDFSSYTAYEAVEHLRDLRWKARYGVLYRLRKSAQYLREIRRLW